MERSLAIIGAPSSAGAYAPGQEKAPAALRAAGLISSLSSRGITVDDRGDVRGFRWRADLNNRRAMNCAVAARVARDTAKRVSESISRGQAVLVLGGDCTVELGTLSGALKAANNIGIVYIDLDTDLNTPESTTDGALDWMGVAHMLGVDGTQSDLTSLGPQVPMLQPHQILFFANGNVEPFERAVIDRMRIAEIKLAQVVADPIEAANAAVAWASRFDHLLVHVDVDVLDYVDTPLAENSRRNIGLTFDQLISSLRTLLRSPNWAALTICELNPDHGVDDGSTLRTFNEALSEALAGVERLTSKVN